MSKHGIQVVQFIHPGFEYPQGQVGKEFTGVMAWKPGRAIHNRKFMIAIGSLLDWKTRQEMCGVPLTFWGEWEGPSVYWRVDSTGRPLPSIVHAPFRPSRRPRTSVQNTDPMVFGSAFIYSNCLQQTFGRLRGLSPGSLVLFGRYGRQGKIASFSLDTCLVIERSEPMMPFADPDRFGKDLLGDAVLGPLQSEQADFELTVYFGRAFSATNGDPFSFFPAQSALDSLALFPRPELRPLGPLKGVVSPTKMQGIKATSVLSETERDRIWTEVVRQVADQGCHLGVRAAAPPLLEPNAAKSAAELPPHPLAP